MELIVFLVVVIILGALAGANSFGETIRSGLGCLGLIIFAVIILAILAA